MFIENGRIKRNKAVMLTAVALIAVLAALFTCFTDTSYAAGGSISVSVTRVKGLRSDASFNFRLYKVGTFEGDRLVLESCIRSSGITLSIPTAAQGADPYNDSQYWSGEWMDSAAALADYIDTLPEDERPILGGEGNNTFSMMQGSVYTRAVAEQGVYLLVGGSAVYDGIRWKPVPMFIVVYSGNNDSIIASSSAVIKLSNVPSVNKYSVTKSWAGEDEHKDLTGITRPEKVRIELLKNGKSEEVVELSEDNNWTYSWEDNGDNEWTCRELSDGYADEQDRIRLEQNYTCVVSSRFADSQHYFTITNTYSRGRLRINKTVTNSDHAWKDDKENNTIVFELTGYDSNGESVYSKYVSMQYDITSGKDQYLDVGDIPANVKELMVTEKYTGGLEPVGKIYKYADYDALTNSYSVSFTNTYSPGEYTGGIINRYQLKKSGSYYGYKFIGAEPNYD